ncbi:MAG: flagellar biosynthetic protein FliO [Deltaproteobacteria bacterium]|nr:MAG: flagellar biosynthetic protein FliO [Deltaproteobacteria bacterium]
MEGASVTPDVWMLMVKSIGMLCIVLGLLVGVLVLVKKMSGKTGQWGGRGYIKVLSTAHVASKERVVLIDVLGEKILIGVTPQSVTRLAVIDRTLPDADASGGRALFPKRLRAAEVAAEETGDVEP